MTDNKRYPSRYYKMGSIIQNGILDEELKLNFAETYVSFYESLDKCGNEIDVICNFTKDQLYELFIKMPRAIHSYVCFNDIIYISLEKFPVELFKCDNIISYLFINFLILKIIDPYPTNGHLTYLETKRLLRALLVKCNDSSKYSYNIKQHIRERLQEIKSHQLEEGSLENAMTSYKPIAPYTAQIENPLLEKDEVKQISFNLYAGDNTEIIYREKHKVMKCRLINTLLDYITREWVEIATTNLQIPQTKEVTNVYLFIVKELVKTIDTDYNSKQYKAIEMVNDLLNPKTRNRHSFNQVVSAMESAIIDSQAEIEQTDEGMNEEIEELKQSDRRMYNKIQNLKGDKDQSQYNIDKITNHMAKNLHLKTSDVLNSDFIKRNKKLSSPSYLNNNLMVVEYDDKYLISPVIDVADNWKYKFIKLDKDSNISIINSLNELDDVMTN